MSIPLTNMTKDANPSSPHFLFLLADSALPLGSFAFSSGLESYLAHNRSAPFSTFLSLSISSQAATTLPFLLAAYRQPYRLLELDDALDASIMCTVGRRASVAQGRALLSIWERAFQSAFVPVSQMPVSQMESVGNSDILRVLKTFSTTLKSATSNSDEIPPASAHLAPLFGVISRVSNIPEREAAYVYMLSHVKALLSAAVRAGVFGPYQSQKLLASKKVQEMIESAIETEWGTGVEDAGQCLPIMDLWIGRHELLYSRIFNS